MPHLPLGFSAAPYRLARCHSIGLQSDMTLRNGAIEFAQALLWLSKPELAVHPTSLSKPAKPSRNGNAWTRGGVAGIGGSMRRQLVIVGVGLIVAAAVGARLAGILNPPLYAQPADERHLQSRLTLAEGYKLNVY